MTKKKKAAAASKDANANKKNESDDEAAVQSTASKGTSKRRRSLKHSPNLDPKRPATTLAKLQSEVDDPRAAKTIASKQIRRQMNTESSSEEDSVQCMSEQGECLYRSGGSNRLAGLSSEYSDEEVEEILLTKQASIDKCEKMLTTLKEEIKPLLLRLKQKQDARREEEAAEFKRKQLQKQQQLQLQQQKQQHQPQQQKQQQQQQPQQQKQQKQVANNNSNKQQQKQPPRPITGAAQPGPSTSGAPKQMAAAAPKLPATQAAAAVSASAPAARPTSPPPAPSTSAAAMQQHQKQPQPTRNKNVPPIRTHKIDLDDVKQVCKSATNGNFYIKIINEKEKRYSVQCFTLPEYNTVKDFLTEATAEFFSFTPRSEKLKTVLLKGISSCTEPEALLDELRQKAGNDLEFIGVKPFSTVKSRRGGYKLPMFLVTLSPQSKLESLRSISVLDFQVVRWEKLMRHDDMLQCMRCQRFGHAAANCQMQERCVKCAETHIRGECRLGTERVEDLTQLKCIICGNEGHPANYRGCPKVQQMKEKQASQKAVESRPLRQAPKANSFVRPDISYANSAKGMGNAKQAPPPVAPQAQVPKAPAGQPDIVALLVAIQGQLAGLQSQILEQAGRVDKLYSMMAGQAQIQG